MLSFGKKTKRCPYCSEEILETAIKCRYCGSYVDNDTKFDPHTFVKVALSSKYKIISEIGRGGMSTVYKAAEFSHERIVALKVIHPNLLHDKELLDRFHREAKISSELHHYNIIKVYEEGIENGIHYMSMELLEGKDLHKKIKENGPLRIDEFYKIFIPIANALSYVHNKGLVHRDVKSGNIFITLEDRPVLMDFGIAHVNNSGQLTMSGSILGTPEFMSPEQAEGKDIDATSDIYSLGVVMYQSLTGCLPYTSDNPLITISKILNEKYIPVRTINPSIPESIENIIDKCLYKNKENRIQSGEELIQLLLKDNLNYQGIIDDQKTIKITPKDKIYYVPIREQNKETNKLEKQKIIKTKTKQDTSRTIYALVIIGVIIVILLGIISNDNSNRKLDENIIQQKNQNEKLIDNTIQEKNFAQEQTTNPALPKSQDNLNQSEVNQSQTEIKNIAKNEIREVEVPDLIGAHIDAARKIIKASNLRVGAIEKIPNPLNVNIVLRQIPKPGSKIKEGSFVNLIIGAE